MLDLLYSRRSVRSFLPKSIEQEKVHVIEQALLLSPAGHGKRHWEFVMVDDRDILFKLSKSKEHGAAFLEGAPFAVVTLGNPEVSDTWIEDTSIASTYAFLAAESIGLGACWIQIRGRNYTKDISSDSYIKELLNIPAKFSVESIIAIGYPDKKPHAYTKESLLLSKLHRNGF